MTRPSDPSTPFSLGAALLLAATVAALVGANSPWADAIEGFWHRELGVLGLDVRDAIDEGLMAVFFFVVGLEVRHELVAGELRDRRRAALPVVAAAGGMVVPALVYAAINAGGRGSVGWGIPMATDIVFAVAVLGIAARRAPPALRSFLLTLAVVDDIGAIAVIALFYSASGSLGFGWLAAAALVTVGASVAARTVGLPSIVVVGVALAVWLAVHEAGVHATVAGVALACVVPITRAESFRRSLEPIADVAIVPLFTLANAGVSLNADALRAAAASPVTLGVVAGLVAGKLVGITGFAWLATRAHVASLPAGLRWRQVVGVAALGGVGFTVSLFVAALAFDDKASVAEAKVGILVASTLATVVGAVLLRDRQPSGHIP